MFIVGDRRGRGRGGGGVIEKMTEGDLLLSVKEEEENACFVI